MSGVMVAKVGAEFLPSSTEARLSFTSESAAVESLSELLNQFDHLFDLSNFGRPV